MVANEAREAGRPIMVAPVDGLVEQATGTGAVVDFTDQDSIRGALRDLRSAKLQQIAKHARSTVSNCYRVREAQWSALLR